MRGRMCLHISFGKWSKQGKRVWNFDHWCFPSLLLPFFVCLQYMFLSPPLPPAVRCDTVCDNTNTSFCHCRRANRLIGLPCYPTQTVRPKESTAHFHNVIDRVPRRDGAWKYAHTPSVLFACLLPRKSRRSRHEARRANLKLCCTSNIPPPTAHTQLLTHQNHSKKKKKKRRAKHFGRQEVV